MRYFLIYITERVYGYDGTIENTCHYCLSTKSEDFVNTLTTIKAQSHKSLNDAIKSVFIALGFEPYLIEDEEEEEDRCPLQWEDGWLTYGNDEIAWQLAWIEELTEEEFKTLTKFNIGIEITHKEQGE